MKRRDVIKGLPFLPMAGGLMAMPLTGQAETRTGAAVTSGDGLLGGPDQNIFRSLGVEPVINCRGTFTIIGGSLERPSVRAAMEAASRSFVQYDELADGIHKRLAELTQAPWAMVSAGCAAGLKHVTAACVSGGNPEKLVRIPYLTGLDKTEVIIPISSRNVYDHAIRNVGVRVTNVYSIQELEAKVNPGVAMIYLTSEAEGFPLEQVSTIAKKHKVPVLVDAAAEDLTVPNVHLQKGADIVAYSGGKAMCGPQCAGLLIGNKDILMSAWQASSPHHGPGRDNKVGREEMIGMLAAVEAWVTMDHKEQWSKWLELLGRISKAVAKVEGVTAQVDEPTELSNHSPTLNIKWDADKLHITGEEVAEELGKTKPRIALGSGGAKVGETGETSIDITSGQLQAGEEKVVAERVREILSQKREPKSTSMEAPVANLTGRWDVQVKFFSSTSMHNFTIQQDGNWISGSHKGDFSVRDMEGSLSGKAIKLRSVDRAPGDHITFIFSGEVTAENMSGSIFMGEYRTATFTAVKQKEKKERRPFMIPSGPPLAT